MLIVFVKGFEEPIITVSRELADHCEQEGAAAVVVDVRGLGEGTVQVLHIPAAH